MGCAWYAFGSYSVLMPNERNTDRYKLGLRQLAAWHEHCATKGRTAKISYRYSPHFSKEKGRES